MAIKKFSPLLAENPLCGIDEHKDVLDLSTGGVTRRIKKLVLDGTEDWERYSGLSSTYRIDIRNAAGIAPLGVCTHFSIVDSRDLLVDNTFTCGQNYIYFRTNGLSLSEWMTYLAQQYANDTPVTVWYVLATPETETITVPSGLTGTIEGYLTQSGTPTPSDPIYPEANPALAWVPTTYHKYGTETDTITSMPAQIIGDGQPIASCQISGNMTQTGTPAPDAPIYPQECGERTGNLFTSSPVSVDYPAIGLTCTYNGSTLSLTGTVVGAGGRNTLMSSSFILKAGQYAFAANTPIQLVIVDESTNTNIANTDDIQFNLSSDSTVHVGVNCLHEDIGKIIDSSIDIMLNTGSTPLPYEPYGYKLPISCGTTTNVYLGETQSTRRIKKLVLTGEEDWTYITGGKHWTPVTMYQKSGLMCICSHYIAVENSSGSGMVSNGQVAFYSSAADRLIFCNTNYATAEDWKAYLAQQYTAGTPVTVWYILAVPETTTLNEPIRKIGDHADTVTATNIPTTGTPENFDVGTTLKPSEVSLTYHGWHEHEDTKFTQS